MVLPSFYSILYVTAVLQTLTCMVAASNLATSKKDLLKQTKLPPCRACRLYVDSFKAGMKKTENSKFEGGDAAWEEEKLRTYAKSEVRLVEIQEKVCEDVVEGQAQCYAMNEQHDTDIEDWWFHKQDDHPDLFQYFCIDFVKHCCPEQHFGVNCTACDGFPDDICSNNGKCKGAGTRKGNGQCACDQGYAGLRCETCAEKYFEAYKDEKKLLCAQCHASCEGSCTKAGPTGCLKCAHGWISDKEKGCLDLNECAAPKSPCSPLQFCVNSDGSYKCLDCDRSCAGCTGDGPDMCIRCASGYVLRENMCVDSAQESRQNYVLFTRYATYAGLCIATCIIFQRSMVLASAIGLLVGLYITTSEYVLNSAPTPNQTHLAEQIMRATSDLN
ncbi:cysteine-rich with EGF-like domain protein 2 isoform X1 [Atheta coriaria]|uniref:cysteine-rich with EGF-like domain protein 2 isoform X1 n=2 Tax=Dalotia coriaria TaxID=877792 RepID=UPI0031F42F02